MNATKFSEERAYSSKVSLAVSAEKVFQRFDDCSSTKNPSNERTTRPRTQGTFRFGFCSDDSAISLANFSINTKVRARFCPSCPISLSSKRLKSLTSIFHGPDGRLRSGWRALVFVFAFGVTALISGTVGYAALNSVGIEMRSWASLFLVANGFISLVPALLVGWACGKLLEDLPYKALGAAFSRHWFVNFISGNVLGFLTLGLAVAVAMIFGGMRFELNNSGGSRAVAVSLVSSLSVFAVASAFEEALFRGYILQTFARSGLAWLAILITAIFFGAVHTGNPNAGTISTINTVLAGIWFGVAYLKTRDLWFVWGLHLMWNFAQGSIFGIEVSGMQDLVATPLMREIDSGPLWLTGETYGIEGGFACTIALIVSGSVIRFLPFPKADPEMLAMTELPAQNIN